MKIIDTTLHDPIDFINHVLPFNNTVVIVSDDHGRLGHFILGEVLRVQMVLRGHPADVNMRRVLTGENPVGN